jgi:hypothetical protein
MTVTSSSWRNSLVLTNCFKLEAIANLYPAISLPPFRLVLKLQKE